MSKNTNSVTVKSQKRIFRGEWMGEDGKPRLVIAEVRWDDQCGNGYNTFAVTGSVYGPHGHVINGTAKTSDGTLLFMESCGCVHEDIAAHIPELAPMIRWHLFDPFGPMHYVANTVYLAGDRDCWGMKKGEFQQHTSRGQQNNGVAGVPNWVLELPEVRDMYAAEKPAPVTLEWKPYGRTGEGKERELDAARHTAVWPDATDEELSADPETLKAALLARLPKLLAEFRAAVESLGFNY